MQAVKGYVENGQFHPLGAVALLPGRIKAVLTILDEPSEIPADKEKAERLEWLRKFDEACKEAASEDMPDFPRACFNRDLIDLQR